MKLKSTLCVPICDREIANSILKKIAFTVFLLCGIFLTSNAQSHDDTTIVLEKNAFAVTIHYTPDGLLTMELLNNQASEITPFFIEAYVKGYIMNESHLVQSINNMLITDNIEHIFGPQFMGLGINSLPALGSYKTTLKLTDRTNEANKLQIRISGTLNGQHVIWFGSYNF